jgi:hypothetical protein
VAYPAEIDWRVLGDTSHKSARFERIFASMLLTSIAEIRSHRLSAVLLLAAVDCSSGGGSTPSAASVLTPAEQTAKLCDDVAAPFCDALFACCADPQTLGKVGGSVAACNTQFAASCKHDIADAILPTALAGATVLDTTRLSNCVDLLRGMKAGGAACTRPPRFVVELDCIAAFRGQLDDGAACDASMLHDIAFVPCKAGTCQRGTCRAFLAKGATCDPATNNTAAGGCNFPDGYNCSDRGTVGSCMPRGALGDACDTKASSFSCTSMSCDPSGTCIAPTGDRLCAGG